MAFRRSQGGFAESPSSVTATQNLSPTLPTIRFLNEMLMLVTIAPRANLTSVISAAPAGWTAIAVTSGNVFAFGVYVRLVDGTETAPTVSWSGLTTGTSGSPAIASVFCLAGLKQQVSGIIADLGFGPSEQTTASSTVQSAGGAITTFVDNAVVFMIAARNDDDVIGFMGPPPPNVDGIPAWTRLDFEWTTSGADAGFDIYWGTKPVQGAIAAKTLNLTGLGATSRTSAGLMFALAPGPPIYSPYMSIL